MKRGGAGWVRKKATHGDIRRQIRRWRGWICVPTAQKNSWGRRAKAYKGVRTRYYADLQ
jgi:hypothetical protein